MSTFQSKNINASAYFLNGEPVTLVQDLKVVLGSY